MAAWHQSWSNEAFARQRFLGLSEEFANRVLERLGVYEYGLRGARGAIVSMGEQVTRERFRSYHMSREIDREFPGARGFGFIRRVPLEQEAGFVARARIDGAPDFTIRALTPHTGDRYVIQYIEPVERNAQAVGLDIASSTERREAAFLAMRTGQAILTAPITLVQVTGQPSRGFLFMLPVYKAGAALDTTAEREAAAYGWSYAPLLIDEILKSIAFDSTHVGLKITDRATAANQPFFETPAPGPSAALLQIGLSRPILGRTWHFDFAARRRFIESLRLLAPGVVFIAGAFASLLAGALVYAYELSRWRKRQLEEQRARTLTIVENASDAIITVDGAGVVTGWNRAAEQIFGHASEQAVGRVLAVLVGAGRGTESDASLLARVLRGERVAAFDDTRKSADGTDVEISVATTPVTVERGVIVGAALMIRDIRDRKRAERQLGEWNSELERVVADRTGELDTARRHLQTIFDALPSMIGYWDDQLTNRYANRAYADWFQCDPEKLPGTHMRTLLGATLFESNQQYIESALRGETQTFERTLQTPNGVRHSLAHYLPDMLDGHVRGFYVLVHDVTELTENRLKLTSALRENAALLATLDRLAIVSMADRRGRILYVNETFCRISGYSREELVGQDHRVISSIRAGLSFDAILMDVQMPGMDGLEATRRIRTELGLDRLPVIALTAGALTSERQRAMDAGMNAFATKPFDASKLVRLVRTHLERTRGEQVSVRRRASSHPFAAADFPQIDGISLDSVPTALRADAAQFKALLRVMLRDSADLTCERAPELGTAEQRKRYADRIHKLGGSAGVLGAMDVHRLASRAEAALRAAESQRDPVAAVRGLCMALAEFRNRALPYLEAVRPFPRAQAVASTELDPSEIPVLVSLLLERDLSAREKFKALATALASRMDPQTFGRLHEAIDSYQFDEAATILGTMAA
jgi:PAS domain S-box-containing protein